MMHGLLMTPFGAFCAPVWLEGEVRRADGWWDMRYSTAPLVAQWFHGIISRAEAAYVRGEDLPRDAFVNDPRPF